MIGYGDPERIVIILLIIASIYLIIKDPRYDRTVKWIKIVPRLYLLSYYALVTFDVYVGTGFESLVRTGIGSVYGIMLLFIAEVYIQWANKYYGRR